MDKKKLPPEAKDVTEPLPGMLDPISQAKMDKKKETAPTPAPSPAPIKKAKGGMIGSASKRADGCAQRGKTRGKMV